MAWLWRDCGATGAGAGGQAGVHAGGADHAGDAVDRHPAALTGPQSFADRVRQDRPRASSGSSRTDDQAVRRSRAETGSGRVRTIQMHAELGRRHLRGGGHRPRLKTRPDRHRIARFGATPVVNRIAGSVGVKSNATGSLLI
ncbi:hypothetical protein [Streptosporangium sp. H16]|uniref:hypothetical protein n=1 Tax=Streptosporangium sp. H16 TaxID=3444184 RepID=UPI003F796625